jgi:prepilin-type N-terminal cleavage/methylation domain-containing protein
MRRRQGFTLVELLVSMALIIFIMSILSEAFAKGMDTFRSLKALGDLQDKLRTTANVLRRDLAADHFQGKARMSDANFWHKGPPEEGFFRVIHGSPVSTTNPAAPYYFEGQDTSGIPTFRASDQSLHFTVKYRGDQRDSFLLAGVPAGSPLLLPMTAPLDTFGSDSRFQDTNNVFNYAWAEVAYFLLPSVDATGTVETTDGTIRRYTLYRRQKVAVPDNSVIAANVPQAQLTSYLESSCYANPDGNGSLYFNSPSHLTMPVRRLLNGARTAAGPLAGQTSSAYPTLQQEGAAQALQGADVLMTDVISFDVRLLIIDPVTGQPTTNVVTNGVPSTSFIDLNDARLQQFSMGNPAFSANGGVRVYDTWSKARDNIYDYTGWVTQKTPTTIPIYRYQTTANGITTNHLIRVLAVQVTIRAWDVRTNQTRQVTIVQDL